LAAPSFYYGSIFILEKKSTPISLPTPKSNLIVMGASLEYMIMKEGGLQSNRNKAFMPAGIVDVILV